MRPMICLAFLSLSGVPLLAQVTNPVSAPDMVVTPTRTESLLTDVAVATAVIGRDAIDLQAPGTVDALFRSMPGVTLLSSDFPGEPVKLNMRGLTSGFQTKRVLVMQDGRRINEQYQGNAEFMTLPADTVERIEAVRGPGSALYGSGAMGGVINIITRRGGETPATSLSAGYGTYNTIRTAVRHGAAYGAVDYHVGGSFIETDGYLSRDDGTPLDWRAYHADGNLGWRINDRAALRFYTGAYAGDGTEFSATRKARKDYQMGELIMSGLESFDGTLTLRLYRNGQHDAYGWFGRGTGIYDQETLAAEAAQSLWATDRHRLTLGGELRRDSVDVREVDGDVDAHHTVYAVFAQDEMFLTDRWRVQAGLRMDHNVDYDTTWSPRIAALYRLSPQQEIYASYNRAHRAPALADRFARAIFWNMLFIGNPDLEPETLDAYEIGLRQRFADWLGMEVTVFFNDMRDSYESVFDPVQLAFRPENISNTQTYGVEAGTHARLAGSIGIFANYTFTEGEYVKDGRPDVAGNRVPYLARHKANTGVSIAAGRTGVHALSVHGVGSRFATVENTPESKLDGYALLHWSSRIGLAPYAWLRLNINNVTDKTYRHFQQFDQPGRMVSASLELVF